MDTTGTFYTVTESGTRLNRAKNLSIEFQEGQQITPAEAYDFGFTDEAGAAVFARPVDETPDIAPDELEKRGLGPAPENKADATAARREKK